MTGRGRVPIHPALWVKVSPAVYGAGYVVDARWSMGAPHPPSDLAFYAPDVVAVGWVLAHVLEGRHSLGDAVLCCPVCELDRALASLADAGAPVRICGGCGAAVLLPVGHSLCSSCWVRS